MSIPMNDIIKINPGVLSAGGKSLALNGLVLSQNTDIPTGGVLAFGSALLVGDYFGTASDEYLAAVTYYDGYSNSFIKPANLFIAPYNLADRTAFIRGGSLSGTTLVELQAFVGTLILDVDGTAFTSASINLASSTSFSDAATLITAGFTVTGAPVCTFDAIKQSFVLSSTTSGITSTITYATGTLSADLKFTSATGAILSQGAALDTVTTAMNNITVNTQNWVTFTTIWEPVIAEKQNFASWSSSQNSRYMYVAWDTDAQAFVNGSTTCFGVIAKTNEYDGTMAVYNDLDTAMMILGSVASIDFSRRNGRITIDFKSLSGKVPVVTDKTVSDVLLVNGYNYYGRYATSNDNFNFFFNGQLSGKWLWLDDFVNQVYMNSQFQLALVTLLTSIGSVPYNAQGNSYIKTTLKTPIDSALNFGGIRAGITLSGSQKTIINSIIGKDVTGDIFANGYYLQVLSPTPTVRSARGTPVINFYYTDGGAVQKITMPSIDVI